jgi:flagellar P-ring protein precursor FlgI
MKSLVLAAALVALFASNAEATRIKDISSIQGVRDNQLFGYGLVVGLQGTGDSMRNSPFTQNALKSMLDRMGVNVVDEQMRVRNIAGVMVTANLPAFATSGTRIDVEISSIGDAVSLKGGTLLMTPLDGADGQIYAVAQGPISGAGFVAGGAAASVSQGVPTGGRIPNGAIVEKELGGTLDDNAQLIVELYNPDFATATQVADAVNDYARARFGVPVARERDMRSISLVKPKGSTSTRFLAEVGELIVFPEVAAKVVINERTGTVVIGQDVQISTVAMAHGNLTVRITETPIASQPLPRSKGRTVVLPRTDVTADEPNAYLAYVGGTSLDQLVTGLNLIGLKPSDIIEILQAIKSAGALQAELVVQ